jgi:hypothetical protein
LRGDEAVHLAEQQRVLGLEQLDPGDLGPAPVAGGHAEDDERDVVARVFPHDLFGCGGPVQPLHLPAGVLDDDRRRLRRLAVAHRLLPARFLAPAVVVLNVRREVGDD